MSIPIWQLLHLILKVAMHFPGPRALLALNVTKWQTWDFPTTTSLGSFMVLLFDQPANNQSIFGVSNSILSLETYLTKTWHLQTCSLSWETHSHFQCLINSELVLDGFNLILLKRPE